MILNIIFLCTMYFVQATDKNDSVMSPQKLAYQNKVKELWEKHAVPEVVQKYILENEDSIFEKINNDLPLISPYGYLKPDISRFEGKEILDTSIKKIGTNLIFTPEKEFFMKTMPDGTIDLTKCCVLSKTVEGKEIEKLTFAEIKQLFGVLLDAQYKDLARTNMIRTPSGKICIVDTAKNSFSKRTGKELENKIALRLLSEYKDQLTDTAKLYLENKTY